MAESTKQFSMVPGLEDFSDEVQEVSRSKGFFSKNRIYLLVIAILALLLVALFVEVVQIQ